MFPPNVQIPRIIAKGNHDRSLARCALINLTEIGTLGDSTIFHSPYDVQTTI